MTIIKRHIEFTKCDVIDVRWAFCSCSGPLCDETKITERGTSFVPPKL